MPYANHSTAQLIENWNNSKLAAAIRYLIYNHSTFLRRKVIRVLPNATILSWS